MARLTPLWLKAGSYPADTDRQLVAALYPAGGVIGCAVTPGGAMRVNVAPGRVPVPVADGSVVLCPSTAVEVATLDPAPPSGTDRQDLIVCTPRSAEWGAATEDFIFAVVKGAEGAPPGAVPAVPAGSGALAQIHVAGGTAALTAAMITDRRIPPAVMARTDATQITPLHPLIGGAVMTSNIAGAFYIPLPPGGRLVSARAVTGTALSYHLTRDTGGTPQGANSAGFILLETATGLARANVAVGVEWDIWFTLDPSWQPAPGGAIREGRR